MEQIIQTSFQGCGTLMTNYNDATFPCRLIRIIRHMCSKHKHAQTHTHQFKGKGKSPRTEFTYVFCIIFRKFHQYVNVNNSFPDRETKKTKPLICHPSQQRFVELTFQARGKISLELSYLKRRDVFQSSGDWFQPENVTITT